MRPAVARRHAACTDAAVRYWDPERDDSLVCVSVRPETHDVTTFVFSAPEPCRFGFQAGQFLTFTFDVDGQQVSRCYTIASPPTRPDRVAITVKRQPGGRVSAWLHANLRPGMRVEVAGPMGDFFTAIPPTGAPRLMISGGSGITPLMSAARAAADLAHGGETIFVHAARSPADIIFRAELSGLPMRVAIVCERDSPGEVWPGFRGRLSLALLRLIAPDLVDREVFCCGPAPFMAAVRAMLAEAGCDPSRYHEESFDFATLTQAAQTASPGNVRTAEQRTGFAVLFQKSGRTVTCGPETTVLEAARAAGLRLPSSCTRGLCGTCKSRMVSGRVDMRHQGGIRQREIDSGMVLLCCSRPLEDLVIDR